MSQRSAAQCQTVRREILEIRDRGRHLGLSDDEIYKVFQDAAKSKPPSTQQLEVGGGYRLQVKQKLFSIGSLSTILVVFLAYRVYRATQGESLTQLIYGSKCIYPANFQLLRLFDPLNSCDHCKNLSEVPTYDGDISVEEFLDRHAVSDVPVILRGAAKNWSALTTFSHQYLKQLYKGRDSSLLHEFENCQFLKYSDVASIADLMNISSERAAFKDGESWWYAGWTVCDPYVDAHLRSHFEVPDCVKALDSKKRTLWIFIGPAGQAAATHLDDVKYPSWQAQIAGKKTWTLIPSPECESACKTFSVTVEPGDLLFINTNVWYHSTYVWPGEISITLASEFKPLANYSK